MDINCNIAGDLMAPYLDGTCSRDSREALEGHLAACDSCREKLRRMHGEEAPGNGQAPDGEAAALAAYAKRVSRRRLMIAALSVALGVFAVCALTLTALTLEDMRRTADPPVFSVPPENLDPNADNSSVPWDPSIWEGVYDLTAGPLETTAGKVGEYVLFTNNQAIAVEISGEDGAAELWNTEYPAEPIQISPAAPHVFHGLSARWRYRVTVDAPEDTPVTVTDGRVASFRESLKHVLEELF